MYSLTESKFPWVNFYTHSNASTVRAPVFGRHQFFGTSEHYGKAHGSLLSGWMNYNYTACCWFPTSSNILILPSQFWQIRFESCWLHCSKCRILVLLRYWAVQIVPKIVAFQMTSIVWFSVQIGQSNTDRVWVDQLYPKSYFTINIFLWLSLFIKKEEKKLKSVNTSFPKATSTHSTLMWTKKRECKSKVRELNFKRNKEINPFLRLHLQWHFRWSSAVLTSDFVSDSCVGLDRCYLNRAFSLFISTVLKFRKSRPIDLFT